MVLLGNFGESFRHRSVRRVRTIVLVGVVVLLGACANVETCEEPQFYESARSGKRIEAPEGLDGLAANKELVVPAASPRPPRAPGSGCVDRPPTLRTGTRDEEPGS